MYYFSFSQCFLCLSPLRSINSHVLWWNALKWSTLPLSAVHALEFTLPSVRVNTSLREESWQLFASFTQQSPYFPSKLENKSDVPLYSKLHLPFPLSSLTFLNVIIILSSWLRKYPFSFVLPIYCVCPQQTAAITLTHAVIVLLSTGYLPRMNEKWVIR